ncbi:hypothetical protein FY145_07235 [Agrobacterium tumefaciens]|uniref:Uncharacterized protein n=1 Tax=Agrobacterium tumefaciens TaxID=358 RepID=A0AAP9E3B2_AGRTU|nr:hypothetical protein [Agrobacterium tumefaciens]NSZ57823.1 hypothetical protein [Agrobacterium tumefaciens]QDY93942.1 hypothetical protein CG010_007235 [Agrobacterium tumefaciens]UXS49014.1 hypothetical protein FY149_17355 [Agrobacterium tumefaciens]UXS70318.1 hypothetical protein FY146_07235 [Agrobacterium tumefaciens]UXS77980.1 hypothetical protein FY145_07235 [Agrobacterium tumefaciens]
MTDIPDDIMKSAEEALDKMLCNCRESCGGTQEGLRAASIADIAEAIMAEREHSRQLLSEAEKREREARGKALEESAQVAERDVDWSAFGKRDIQPWENGNDSVRDYRLGIATGRAIAASIRALQSEER